MKDNSEHALRLKSKDINTLFRDELTNFYQEFGDYKKL